MKKLGWLFNGEYFYRDKCFYVIRVVNKSMYQIHDRQDTPVSKPLHLLAYAKRLAMKLNKEIRDENFNSTQR